MEFRKGDKITVNNPKLKTHGLNGVILGKHYNDDQWGTFSCCYNVLIDDRIETFIGHNNMELQKADNETIFQFESNL